MTEIAEVKTIGEVERIVHASGLWDGTSAVEFSDDGETWTEAWRPARTVIERDETSVVTEVDADSHPEYARVTVYRKDVRVPTKVTIRWDEQVPIENEEWVANWRRSPMRHFGRTARMVGYRQTFRDILGDVAIEDEERATTPAPAEAPPRDWATELTATETIEAHAKLVQEARDLHVFSPDKPGTDLWRLQRDHGKALALVADAWEPAPAAPPTPAAPPRPQPKDHLPATQNRAARRAGARKKGGRR